MTAPRIIETGIKDVTCAEGVRVMMPSNLYGCRLGASVFVGPFVEIQAGVVVGDRTKIQSHAFLCELVSIGDDCFVGHGVTFINDVFRDGGPAGGDRSKWGTTKVGNRVSIGSNATILPVDICDDVVIGAGAVVTRHITEPGVYAGNPARLMRRQDPRAPQAR